MLAPRQARACRRAFAETEVHAVQRELQLPVQDVETVLFALGIRRGIFEADIAFAEIFRPTEFDAVYAGAASASQKSSGVWPKIAQHLLSWTGEPHRANGDHHAACGASEGNAGVTATGAAAPPPPFSVSWRTSSIRPDSDVAAPGDQHGSAHPGNLQDRTGGAPTHIEGGETSAAGVRAPTGPLQTETAGAARPDAPPAGPRHLGMGIIVGAAQSPVAATAQTEATNGPRTAAGEPPLQPHPGARARQQSVEVFSRYRPRAGTGARCGGASKHASFGGPLPTWYTRGPGLGQDQDAAALAQSAAHPPRASSPAQRPRQQDQLGCPKKRTREAIGVDAGSRAGPVVGDGGVADAVEDDGEMQGHPRSRPRPSTTEASNGQERLHNHPQQPQLLPQHQATRAAVQQGAFPGVCDPAIVPQPVEPVPEAAPYGELLYAIQRMGCDLCRRASYQARDSDGAVWRPAWVRVLLRVSDQLRRLLNARSAVTKYDRVEDVAGDLSQPTQPLTNHAQLRAVVQLLLLVATELPPGKPPRSGVAAEAQDAIDYLLCSCPFVDFDGCDPQARAVLVDGVLQLARLGAERASRDRCWHDVRDRALQTLTSWLVRQSDLVRDLGSPSFDCKAGSKLGGLVWVSLPDEEQRRERLTVHAGHLELFSKMAASLAVLALHVGAPLASRLLDPDVVRCLLQPPCSAAAVSTAGTIGGSLLPLDPSLPTAAPREDALVLLHAAVMALAQGAAQSPGGAGLAEAARVVVQCGVRTAAEQVLISESKSAEQLLLLKVGHESRAVQAATTCRDLVVPLLGTVYAVLLARGDLAGWPAVEGAIHLAAMEGSHATGPCPLRRVWEQPADRRHRGLAVYLQAQVVRALTDLGQEHLLEEALRCELTAPGQGRAASEQLGVVGMWLRAALDCSSRPMFAALTAEMLQCGRIRHLLGLPLTTTAADGYAVEDLPSAVAVAIAEDVDGTVSAQLVAALTAGLVRERRFADLRAALCGLESTWKALRRELPRTGGSAASAAPPPIPCAQLGGGVPPVTLQAHRAMACVALAALEPCAAGFPAPQTARTAFGGYCGAGGMYGMTTGRQARVLECVAETVVEDAAALVRWEACATGVTSGQEQEHAARWAHRLRGDSVAGLLSDLVAALARCTDCRSECAADMTPQQGEHSVLQRSLALLCVMISELPPAVKEHAATNELFREHVVAAFMDHLRSGSTSAAADPAQGAAAPGALGPDVVHRQGPGLSGAELADAQTNLARMLHRCIAGALRTYVVEGLKAPVPRIAPVRHAGNALAWLRCMLRHPAMRQLGLLERLLPALLNLLVEGLVAARQALLSRGSLQHDTEKSAQQPAPSQPQNPQPPASAPEPAPLGLIRDLLDMCADVMSLTAGSDLLASREEAATGAVQGAVRIEASPLLLMEAAPRNQLRVAAGFVAALMLRTCLECAVLPGTAQLQQLVLAGGASFEEHWSFRVQQRLASYFGNPPALGEAERPRAVRQACGQDAMKLSSTQASTPGPDGSIKLAESATDCISRIVAEPNSGVISWVHPIEPAFKKLIKGASSLGMSLSYEQKRATLRLLLLLKCYREQPGPSLAQTAPRAQSDRPAAEPTPGPNRAVQPQRPQHEHQPSQQQQQREEERPALRKAPHAAAVQSSAESQSVPRQSASGQATNGRVQAHAAGRDAGSPEPVAVAAAAAAALVPSHGVLDMPKAHYVGAPKIGRSEDHRLRLQGCMPFADLASSLQEQGHKQPPAPLASQTVSLPPLVGQVVQVRLTTYQQMPILCMALRDASVEINKPVVVLVVGPTHLIELIKADLGERHPMVGVYGAAFLGGAGGADRGAAAGGGRPAAGATAAWPLRLKVDLRSGAVAESGLVIEPRTAYTAQLRAQLHALDQRAATSTVILATPATLAVAGTAANSSEVSSSHVQGTSIANTVAAVRGARGWAPPSAEAEVQVEGTLGAPKTRRQAGDGEVAPGGKQDLEEVDLAWRGLLTTTPQRYPATIRSSEVEL